MGHPFSQIYDSTRSFGIYVHGTNRFILVDNNDLWITMETAKVLSSKVVSSVCVLPPGTCNVITNDNCMSYTIFNELESANLPLTIIRQLPTLRIYDRPDVVGIDNAQVDIPLEDLIELKEFAAYTHKVVYALKILKTLFNTYENRQFAETMCDERWLAGLTSREDASMTPNGTFNKLFRIFYMADSVIEAKQQLLIFLRSFNGKLNNRTNINLVAVYFYELMNEPFPAELEFMRSK